jgi:hypothetical protein
MVPAASLRTRLQSRRLFLVSGFQRLSLTGIVGEVALGILKLAPKSIVWRQSVEVVSPAGFEPTAPGCPANID